MKLNKTTQPSIYYVENKSGITYYFNYKDPLTKTPKRKKLFSSKQLEPTPKEIRKCIVMSEDIKKELKDINSSEVIEDINYKNYINLNILGKEYFKDRHNTKKRILRERFNHLNDEEFEKNVVVIKGLYNVRKELLRFEKHINDSEMSQISVNKISKNVVKDYIENHLGNKNLSEKSKFMIVSMIKTIFNYGIKNDIINIKNPFEHISFKNPKRQRERVLSEDEIKTLLHRCKDYKRNPNVYLSLYLGVLTGGRSNTILNIKKSDIDTNNKIISLYNFKSSKKYQIGLSDKGNEWLRDKVLPHRETNEFLVKSYSNYKNDIVQNQPLYKIPSKVYEFMDKLFNDGLNKQNNFERDKIVNYHTIRRSIGTNLVKNGTSVYNVMKFLDHSTTEQTMKYLNLSNDDIHDDVVKLMDNIFKDF